MSDRDDTKRRRKTRRGTRGAKASGNKDRRWKPYSELSWEERRSIAQKDAELNEKESIAPALQEEHQSKPRNGTMPKAPRITHESLMDEREKRSAVVHLDDLNVATDMDLDGATTTKSSSEDEFEDTLLDDVTEQYATYSRKELVKLLLDKESEIANLKRQILSNS